MQSSTKSDTVVAVLTYTNLLTVYSQNLCYGDESNSHFANALVSFNWPDQDTLEVKLKEKPLFMMSLKESSKCMSFMDNGFLITCETMVSITNVIKEPDCRLYNIKHGGYQFEFSAELGESQPGDKPLTMTYRVKNDPDSMSIVSLIRIKGEITVSIKLPNKPGEELICTFPVTVARCTGETNQGSIQLIATKI